MAQETDRQALLTQVQNKIKQLIQEFGQGLISNEQFNILYERYTDQLNMITRPGLNAAPSDINTITIRQATAGKALGLSLYHHRTGTTLETLGTFDITSDLISSTLNAISAELEDSTYIEPRIQHATREHWLVFVTRDYTTAIAVFRNEPAPIQIREIQRILHDFEVANERFLTSTAVNAGQLARPFLALVKQKLRKNP